MCAASRATSSPSAGSPGVRAGSRSRSSARPTRTPWQRFVYLLDVGSGEQRRLSDDRIDPQTGFFPIAAAPPLVWRGTRVVFGADARGSSGIYSVTTSGRLEALRSRREILGGLDATSDGRRVAFVASSPSSPSQIRTLDLRSRRGHQVTNAGSDYIETHPPGHTERFRVRRAGESIEAWLVHPAGFNPRRRYPVVLEIHGGPNGFHGNGFNPLHQVLAGAGFPRARGEPARLDELRRRVHRAGLRGLGRRGLPRPDGGRRRGLPAALRRCGAPRAAWLLVRRLHEQLDRRAQRPLPRGRHRRPGHQPRLDVRADRYRRRIRGAAVGRAPARQPRALPRAVAADVRGPRDNAGAAAPRRGRHPRADLAVRGAVRRAEAARQDGGVRALPRLLAPLPAGSGTRRCARSTTTARSPG